MDTISAYDEAQSKARTAICANLDGPASDADIEHAAKLVVDNYDAGQSLVLNIRDARNAITDAMGTETRLRGLLVLRRAIEAVRDKTSAEELRQQRWDSAWTVIAEVRDSSPRASDDASTDAIVDALFAAGLIR